MREAMRRTIWTSSQLRAAIDDLAGGPVPGDIRISGVSIDTRTLRPGDLFVALAGETQDGHDYVAAAFAAGAAAALVRNGFTCKGADAGAEKLVPVRDVLKALEALGAAARQRSKAYIIAVTGSVGKTSVKETLRGALARSGRVHACDKSYNNHIGVPLSLARMSADCDFGVFEIGMNHAGEIAALVAMVQPHCAIITRISAAHIEYFESMEDLARAKAEILTGLVPGGAAIVPADSPYIDILREVAAVHQVTQLTGFQLDGAVGADAAVARKIKLHADCSCVSANIMGQEVIYKIGTSGIHHVSNSLAVLACVSYAGGDVALAALSLADNEGLVGRGRHHRLTSRGGQYTLIDESYNANPASMAAAIDTLGLAPRLGHGRRIAVLGDMAELGNAAARLHQELAQIIERADVDFVLSCGRLMQHLHTHLPPGRMGSHAEQPEALADILLTDLHAGDVVMVKGSKVSRINVIVETLLEKHAQPEVAAVGRG